MGFWTIVTSLLLGVIVLTVIRMTPTRRGKNSSLSFKERASAVLVPTPL